MEKLDTGQMLKNSQDGGYLCELKDVKTPMTSQGDLIVGGANGVPTRLAKGTAGQVLTMNSQGTGQEWKTPASTGNLYRHHITLQNGTTTQAHFDLIISRSTKFANISELASYLNTQAYSTNNRRICIAAGYHKSGSVMMIADEVTRFYLSNRTVSFVSFFNPDASVTQGASLEINSTNFSWFDDDMWAL